jgi:AAA+ superfamily predicted ATPase
MTDERLDAYLELLRLALRAYLVRLQESWAAAAGASDVERVVAAAGARADPSADELATARSLLDRARAVADGPLAAIAGALELSAGDEVVVAAAWWAEADPQLAVVLGCAHDDGARRYPSASLLRLALEPFGVAVAPAVDDGGVLVRGGVVEPGAGSTNPIRLTGTARLVLARGTPTPIRTGDAPPRRLAALRAALVRHLESGRGGIVLLRGPTGVGRRALAIAAATATGRIPVGPSRPPAELRLLARLGVALPIVPAELIPEFGWSADDGPLVALGPAGQRAPGVYAVDVPPPDHGERVSRWRRGLATAGLRRGETNTLAPVIAARFAFTEGDIDAVLARAVLDAAWTARPLDRDVVWEAARRQPEHALERVAALIEPAFTLEDLVLRPDALAKLRELVAHVALKHVVFDRWGFRRRMPRGQGVVALFSGPSGTGKTMAAEAVANALRQDLYRVDLSAVVSKYIGETEKNLATAFDEAERGSAVLFFDEADSLYSRRTSEVRDAHDRYANLEVNYLLQRVETFTGLVVLATNRAAALDEAFLRRLRFSIRFDVPDEALRRDLWRRSFPPEATLADLDWDALARAELAGGSIQSAALSAAFLAADDGGCITGAHVEHALRREYEKLGKAWPGGPAVAAA